MFSSGDLSLARSKRSKQLSECLSFGDDLSLDDLSLSPEPDGSQLAWSNLDL